MERLNLLLMIALGGAIGSVSRYLLSTFIHDRILTILPIGTFIINVLGCLFIGLLLKNCANSSAPQQIWRTFFIIGFIGSFTTFATFASDIYELLRNGKPLIGLLYYLGSTFAGIIMIYIAVTFMHIFSSKK
jgi:CrcB protein